MRDRSRRNTCQQATAPTSWCGRRGGIGSIAIRAIHQRPNLDLVGVWVHSDRRRSARTPANSPTASPIGLAATNDADALIALKPDCVVYAASGPERDAAGDPRLREAAQRRNQRGDDEHHSAGQPAMPTILPNGATNSAAAAKEGQVSLYASGIEPGFAARLPCRWCSPRSRPRSRRSIRY